MKTKLLQSAVLAVAATACVSANASLNLVVNGDFSQGDHVGFSSGYADGTGTQNSLLNGGSYGGAGYYAIGTSPSFYNGNWGYGPTLPSTPGGAQMLIVNGSLTSGVDVWQGTLSSALVAGATYTFSARVASLYPVSEPTLNFSIGNSLLKSVTLTGAGTWQTVTENFVAGSGMPSFLDMDLESSGNDFVVTDISISAVPEPSTIIAGALLILPLGGSALRIIRKKQLA